MNTGDGMAEGFFTGGLAGSVATMVGDQEVEVVVGDVGGGFGIDGLDAVHESIDIVGVKVGHGA